MLTFIDDLSRKKWIYFLECKESEEIFSNSFRLFSLITKSVDFFAGCIGIGLIVST